MTLMHNKEVPMDYKTTVSNSKIWKDWSHNFLDGGVLSREAGISASMKKLKTWFETTGVIQKAKILGW